MPNKNNFFKLNKNKIFALLPDISIISSMIFLTAFVILTYFAAFGILRFNFQSEPLKPSPYIYFYWPENETKAICENQTCYREIPTQTTYFTLNLPRFFQEVELEIEYRLDSDTPFTIEVLGGINESPQKTLENPQLDQLLTQNANSIVTEDGLTLIQKNNNYNSISSFLASIPAKENVGAYGVDIYSHLNTNEKKNEHLEIYANEDLNFSFIATGNNQNLQINFSQIYPRQQIEPYTVYVFDQTQTLIHKEKLIPPKFLGNPTHFTYTLPDLPLSDGQYQIFIDSDYGLVVKDIVSSLSGLVIQTPVHYLAQTQITKFWPKVKTSALTLYVNNNELDIYPENQCQITNHENWHKITCAKRGITIFASHPVSYSFQNLRPQKVQTLTAKNSLADFDYILTDYQSPAVLSGNWKKQTVKIPLSAEHYFKNKVNFALTFPQDNGNHTIQVKNMKFSLYANPWSQKTLVEALNSYLHPTAQAEILPLTY